MLPSHHQAANHDVRMRGFEKRVSVEQAIAWSDSALPALKTEKVVLNQLAGRVLAEAITSEVDVPGFDRGMMDGFAVRAEDLKVATVSEPVALHVVGEIYPGEPYSGVLSSGHAIQMMTGAPLPRGADTVLPVEKVELKDDYIVVSSPVVTGKHVGLTGEDVTSGTKVLPTGRRLRPQDIGLLASIGIDEAKVFYKPKVHLVTTGNELLPAGTPPKDYLISDANSPMLRALIERDGAQLTSAGIVPDDPEHILAAIAVEADIVIVSGGSSVGLEDHVPQLLAKHGILGVHGVAMRPSSPLGIGTLGRRLVFLLPGNPVSCLCGYDLFAGRAIRQLTGQGTDWPYRKRSLPLQEPIASVPGRKDYVRVQLKQDMIVKVSPHGASALYSAVQADGFVLIPEEVESLKAGERVTVYLYGPL